MVGIRASNASESGESSTVATGSLQVMPPSSETVRQIFFVVVRRKQSSDPSGLSTIVGSWAPRPGAVTSAPFVHVRKPSSEYQTQEHSFD